MVINNYDKNNNSNHNKDNNYDEIMTKINWPINRMTKLINDNNKMIKMLIILIQVMTITAIMRYTLTKIAIW